jgi:hypothetical protein
MHGESTVTSEPAAVQRIQPTIVARALPVEPRSELSTDVLGQPFQARAAVLAQIGWVGSRGNHHVYALTDPPYDGREPGGYTPLYIQVGNYFADVMTTDERGAWD